MKTPISPKLPAGGVWAGFATLALALLANITPGQLAFLGPEAPLAYGVVIAGAFAVGVYRKEDPLRAAGLAAKRAATDPALSAHLPAGLLDALQSLEDPAPAYTFPAAKAAAAAAKADTPAPATAAAAGPVPVTADPVAAPSGPIVPPVLTDPAAPSADVVPVYSAPAG